MMWRIGRRSKSQKAVGSRQKALSRRQKAQGAYCLLPSAYWISGHRGFLLLEAMVAVTIAGASLAALVTALSRALVVSQVVAEQVAASEAAGRVVAMALLEAGDGRGKAGSLTQSGDPIDWLGRSDMPLGGAVGSDDRYRVAARVEEADGFAWLRVGAEWSGRGGPWEGVERATVVREVEATP